MGHRSNPHHTPVQPGPPPAKHRTLKRTSRRGSKHLAYGGAAEPRDLLTEALGDRYRIERTLSRGGMATVYLARDERHGRRVAIKAMSADNADDPMVDRFLREIQTTARLHHPNTVPVFDSGRAGTMMYFVMPYIAGGSLRDLLNHDYRLNPTMALEIARNIVDALSAAHAAGVVHRDIKPENVMLAGRQALLTDFGVAKLLDRNARKLSSSGMMVGTPAYMAPEQVRGDRSIDPRADIYAVGAVLYEMVTGTPVFRGSTAEFILSAQLYRPPPNITQLYPEVPRPLAKLIMRCLDKDRDRRWPSAAALRREIDRLLDCPRVMAAWALVGRLRGIVCRRVWRLRIWLRRPSPSPTPQRPSAASGAGGARRDSRRLRAVTG